MQTAKKQHKETTSNTQLLFMPKLYDETMHLLVQARNYFNIYSAEDQRALDLTGRTIYSLAMSRIALRLSSTMSWVLARRAFHAGQITEAELAEHFRLGFQDECLRDHKPFEGIMPSFVNKLQHDTLALYARINALDEMSQAQMV